MATKKWKISGATGREADTAPTQSATIYDEAENGLPPAGPYRCVLKQLKVGETSGEPAKPKLSMVFEISEPEGTKKAKYNGYGIWRHQTVVPGEDDGRVNALLEAMFDAKPPTLRKKIRAAFWKTGPDIDSDTDLVLKIGGVAVDSSGIVIGVNTRFEKGTNGYSDKLTAAAVFGESKVKVGAKVEPEDEDDEPEDEEETGEPDEATEREAELEAMKLADLRAEAKEVGVYKRGMSQDDLIDAIMGEEFPEEEPEDPEEEDDEDEPEEDDDEASEEDERREELAELTLAKVKAEAKEAGLKLTQFKGLDKDGIIDLIIGEEFPADDEDEEEDATEEEDEDDEEEEPEPEPAPRARRGRAAATKEPAKATPARRRRSARGGDDDPPF